LLRWSLCPAQQCGAAAGSPQNATVEDLPERTRGSKRLSARLAGCLTCGLAPPGPPEPAFGRTSSRRVRKRESRGPARADPGFQTSLSLRLVLHPRVRPSRPSAAPAAGGAENAKVEDLPERTRGSKRLSARLAGCLRVGVHPRVRPGRPSAAAAAAAAGRPKNSKLEDLPERIRGSKRLSARLAGCLRVVFHPRVRPSGPSQPLTVGRANTGRCVVGLPREKPSSLRGGMPGKRPLDKKSHHKIWGPNRPNPPLDHNILWSLNFCAPARLKPRS